MSSNQPLVVESRLEHEICRAIAKLDRCGCLHVVLTPIDMQTYWDMNEVACRTKVGRLKVALLSLSSQEQSWSYPVYYHNCTSRVTGLHSEDICSYVRVPSTYLDICVVVQ